MNDNDQQSHLTALDARTGKTVWRVDRQEGTNWATPYVWEHAGRTEIVTPATGNIRSYDLEGKLLWQLGPMSSITIPTPFSQFGLLYVTSGYVGDQVRPVYAIRPGASGDISRRMIVAHDQGLSISINRGRTWFRQRLTNAQIYHVTVDNEDDKPYLSLMNSGWGVVSEAGDREATLGGRRSITK